MAIIVVVILLAMSRNADESRQALVSESQELLPIGLRVFGIGVHQVELFPSAQCENLLRIRPVDGFLVREVGPEKQGLARLQLTRNLTDCKATGSTAVNVRAAVAQQPLDDLRGQFDVTLVESPGVTQTDYG